MTTVEGTSGRRHGRRARTVEADGGARQATGDVATLVRRAAILPPAADAALPQVTRFDAPRVLFEVVEEQPLVGEGGFQDEPQEGPGGGADALDSDQSAEFVEAEATEHVEPLEAELDSTGTDAGAEPAGREVEADDGPSFPVSDQGAHKTSWVDSVLGAQGSGGVAAGVAGLHAADEDRSAEAAADDEATGASDAAAEPAPQPSKGDNSVLAPFASEEQRAGDGSEWLEVGDLPAEEAPDPKPAPRFEGQVLNKPSRSATGAGGWVTWAIVCAILVLIIVLFATGMIGPGIASSAPEVPTTTDVTFGGLLS